MTTGPVGEFVVASCVCHEPALELIRRAAFAIVPCSNHKFRIGVRRREIMEGWFSISLNLCEQGTRI